MEAKKVEILEAHSFRRAIKQFEEEKKISDSDFEFILNIGRMSPSSFGWEPWRFVIAQNMELRQKLMRFSWGAKKQLPSASHFVIILARKAGDMLPGSEYLKYKSETVDQLPEEIQEMKLKFFKEFLESEFDLSNDSDVFNWSCKQVYIPLANMMTAAAQIGIDSCPMEGFEKTKIEEILVEEGILDTEHFGVAAMVAFGYRKGEAPYPQTRQTIEQVVQWVN